MTCINETNFPPYNLTSHYIFVILKAAFIPFIVVSSGLTIASVTLLRKLKSPHNYIIRSIAIMDFLFGVAVMPTYVFEEVAQGRKLLLCHLSWWQSVVYARNFIQITNVSFLAVLCIDTFVQINFPVSYINHISMNASRIIVLMVTLVHFIFAVVYFVITFTSGDSSSCIINRNGYILSIVEKDYSDYYLVISVATTGLVCVVLGIQVRVIASRKKSKHTDRFTPWVSMAFCILYLPSGITAFLYSSFEQYQNETWFNLMNPISRLLRCVVSITNGVMLYWTMPVYRFPFRYFLTTRPWRWKDVGTKSMYDKSSDQSCRKSDTKVTTTQSETLAIPCVSNVPGVAQTVELSSGEFIRLMDIKLTESPTVSNTSGSNTSSNTSAKSSCCTFPEVDNQDIGELEVGGLMPPSPASAITPMHSPQTIQIPNPN